MGPVVSVKSGRIGFGCEFEFVIWLQFTVLLKYCIIADERLKKIQSCGAS